MSGGNAAALQPARGMTDISVPAGRTLGYARVSTDQQDLSPQVESLRAAGAAPIFEDVMTGTRADRPGLRALLAEVRHGDTVAVHRLDRLGRSVLEMSKVIADLFERGVGIRGITDGVTSTTKEGRLLLSVLTGVADFEHGLIMERTAAGRKRAKADGVRFGRKRLLTESAEDAILAAIEGGRSVMAVGRDWRVSERTVWRAVAGARTRQDRRRTV